MTFGGRDWRQTPEIAPSVFAVFPVMRQLKELLWYLAEALILLPVGPLRDGCERAREETERLVVAHPDDLVRLDTTAHRQQVGPLLGQVSEVVRGDVHDRVPDRRGADLIGAKLRGADLHGSSLRGTYLIGADLRDADLRKTDLLGADLRGADLRGARLEESLFLTQPQVDAATGDASTTLPPPLRRPRHWSAGDTSTAQAHIGSRRPRDRRRSS